MGMSERKRRRPMLACEQCRRRKVKCDRQMPCRRCLKSNVQGCTYVCDDREPTHTDPPFGPEDTSFSVFETEPIVRPPKLHTSLSPDKVTAEECRPSSHTSRRSSPGIYINNNSNNNNNNNNNNNALLQSPFSQSRSSISTDSDLQRMAVDVASLPLTAALDMATPSVHTCVPALDATSRGSFIEGVWYGPSNWINYVHPAAQVRRVIQCEELNEQSGVRAAFIQCQALAEAARSRDMLAVRQVAATPLVAGDQIPPRPVIESLVHAYLRTFESVFNILDVCAFRRSCDAFFVSGRAAVDDAFETMLLLVMCIGSAFDGHEPRIRRATALEWIQVASTWLECPYERPRLGLDVVRAHCLLLLARMVQSVRGDRVWLSAGALSRTALHMGLHLNDDDAGVAGLPLREIEARRRLWATVLELELQSGMDCGGMPVMYGGGEGDFVAPSNINDADLDACGGAVGEGLLLPVKPPDEFTQCSVQIMLVRTMHVRLRISKFLNDVRGDRSFDEALALSSELKEEIKSCRTLLRSQQSGSIAGPTSFQIRLFELMVQRFLLALHSPFAKDARANVAFYYSKKICLDTALTLCSHSPEVPDDDFDCLRLLGSGIFHDVQTQGAFYLCGELIDELEVDGPASSSPGGSFCRQEMRRAAGTCLDLLAARLRAGENDVRRYVYLSCLVAQIDARQDGAPVHTAIALALRKSLDFCCAVLQSRVALHNSSSNNNNNSNSNNNTHHNPLHLLHHHPHARSQLPTPRDSVHSDSTTPMDLSIIDDHIDWAQWGDLISLGRDDQALDLQQQQDPVALAAAAAAATTATTAHDHASSHLSEDWLGKDFWMWSPDALVAQDASVEI